MASSFGNRVKITIFGQSHSAGIGVTVEGLPVGERVDMDALAAFLSRRAPGGELATPRKEPDLPEILSGLVDCVTCGAPLTAIIRNTNTRSGDYAAIANTPRPGHADYTAEVRYGGFQDKAGGGHFSGRLTAPLCIAGGIALQMLSHRGVEIGAHISALGGVKDTPFDPASVSRDELLAVKSAAFPTLSGTAGEAMCEKIRAVRAAGDSVGGIIECAAVGLPAGIGDPMFDGMENRIAGLVFGIPAVKGVEFGAGFAVADMTGSENNDPFIETDEGIRTAGNNHGGILGGITSGMPLIFRAAFKPTPSIAREQQTVDMIHGGAATLAVRGRHDPCILPRAVPCVEAAAALAILDAWCETNWM
ncbi:MAG: chorismate synthase [Clostridia bacterium]|nr:chorismate synthase [Clostridia bacterium]